MSEIILDRIHQLSTVYQALIKAHPTAVKEIMLSEVPEQVFNSNAIENSTLTLQDTEDILLRDQINRDAEVREIYEAKNLARALDLLAAGDVGLGDLDGESTAESHGRTYLSPPSYSSHRHQ